MAKLAPITIPTEPNDSIPRPLDLIDRVAKSDREEVTAPVDPILPPRKECATVRSNPARIGAGARERLISN